MKLFLTTPRDGAPAGTVVDLDPAAAQPLLESGAARSPGGDVPPRGSYDTSRQLYNWHPGNTRTWRQAVAGALVGGSAHVNVYGPSTVAGYTNTGRSEWHAWPSYLRRLLAGRFGESGTGVVYFHEADPRVVVQNTGWTRESYGPFGVSGWSATGASVYQWLTFGPVRATGFRVTYRTFPGGGKLAIHSDTGQAPTVVDTNGPHGIKTAACPAGPLGDHKLTARPAGDGTGQISILDVEAYVGPTTDWSARGIRVTNVGRGSTMVRDLTGGDPLLGTSLTTAVDVHRADLSIVAYAENSYAHQTPDQFRADMRVLLNRIRASGSDLLLCTSIDWADSNNPGGAYGPQPLFDNAVYELADEYDAAVFDVATRWGRWEDSPAFYADRIHPLPVGYADIAGGVMHAIGTGVW